jgi:hypothetical protein
MLLTTAIFWSIWITRNKITFEGYKLQNPVGIVFTACFFFLKYWASLYKEEDAGKVKVVAQMLMSKAAEMARAMQTSPTQATR